MPAVKRRSKNAPLTPLKLVFFSTLLPYLCCSMSGQDADDFFIHVLLGFQGATGRNLGYIHTRSPFHPIKVNKRALPARTGPWLKLQLSNIFNAVTCYDRDSFFP